MKKLIVVGIVMFILGFYAGTAYTIIRVVDVAVQFVDVDYELVHAALFQYNIKNKLGNIPNAPICYDPRNQTLR